MKEALKRLQAASSRGAVELQLLRDKVRSAAMARHCDYSVARSPPSSRIGQHSLLTV